MEKKKRKGYLKIKKGKPEDSKVENHLNGLTEDEKKIIRLIADIYVNSLLHNIDNQQLAA